MKTIPTVADYTTLAAVPVEKWEWVEIEPVAGTERREGRVGRSAPHRTNQSVLCKLELEQEWRPMSLDTLNWGTISRFKTD